MHKIKLRYTFLVGLLAIITTSPIWYLGLYNQVSADYIINNNDFIQNASIKYNIDLNECLKCQDGGLIFGIVFLVIFLVIMLSSIFLMAFVLSIFLRVLLGWSISKTFNIILNNQYPKTWYK